MYKTIIALCIVALLASSCAAVVEKERTAMEPIAETPEGKSVREVSARDEAPPADEANETETPSGETEENDAGRTDLAESVTAPNVELPVAVLELVQDISVDLSTRLSIDISEIELVEVKEVVWRDSSLGCPQPGMNYLMVLTPGHQITLKVQGKPYFYHTRDTSRFVLCDAKRAVEPLAPIE